MGHMLHISRPPDLKRAFISFFDSLAHGQNRSSHSGKQERHQRKLSRSLPLLIIVATVEAASSAVQAAVPTSLPNLAPPTTSDAAEAAGLGNSSVASFWIFAQFSDGDRGVAHHQRGCGVAAVAICVSVGDVMQSVHVILGLALVRCVAPQVYLRGENLRHGAVLYWKCLKSLIMRLSAEQLLSFITLGSNQR